MQTLFTVLVLAGVVVLGLCAIDGVSPLYIWDLLIGSRIRQRRIFREMMRERKQHGAG